MTAHDTIDPELMALYEAEANARSSHAQSVDLADVEAWRPVDLGAVLAGTVEPTVPDLLTRDDGAALLYRGTINGLHGDSGTGKSMVAAILAAQQMMAGHAVAWFDWEDPGPALIVERLRDLGVADGVLARRFLYLHPDGAPTRQALDATLDALAPHGSVMCVLDSVGESMGAAGLDENSDGDVNTWARKLPRRLEAAGHTVLDIDHTTKAHDNPLHPSGSKRKRAMISGSSWLLEQVTPFDRDHPGKAKLTCAKDRHGNYRRGAIGAWVHIDPTAGGIRWQIEAPGADDSPRGDRVDAVLVARIVDVVKASGVDGLNLRGLRSTVRLKVKATNTVIDDALELALALGCVTEAKGPRNARVFTWSSDPDPDAIERTFA